MVTRREFDRIKRDNPESRIGQRTWKQQQYRNRLYNTFKKGLKKSDADVVVTKINFDKEKKTWEYVSAEFGTTQESAKNMIDKGYFNFVKEHIDIFPEFDNEFAIWLVKKGCGELVAGNFNKFVGLNKEFAMCVIKHYNGKLNIFKRHHKGHGDSTRDECIGVILCELMMKNTDKVSGLDKEFVDEYVNFSEDYQLITSGDAGYYTNNRVRHCSLITLAENIKFIEGIDEKYLLDLVDDFYKDSEHKRDSYLLSKRLLENTNLKFSEDVFYFIEDYSDRYYRGWLCSYLERFKFKELPKDFVLSCFILCLDGFMRDCTNERFLDLVKYIQAHPELGLTIDDLFKHYYDEDMKYDGQYHVHAASRLVKCLPFMSVSKENILKVYKLIITHIPKRDESLRNSLLRILSKFESYIINHPELDISSIDLYYVSMGRDPNKKSPYWPRYDDTIAGFHLPSNGYGYRDPNEPWYFNSIFSNLISAEKDRAAVEEKNRLAQELEHKEKLENEWRENINMIADNSYDDGINAFLNEGNEKHKSYIKKLLLELDIHGQVSKQSFSRLYSQLSPEDQRVLLKKFKRIQLV